MPTENENKYVIWDSDPVGLLRGLCADHRYAVIRQGYLQSKKKMTVRIRASMDSAHGLHHKLTLKKRVGKRVVEIETVLEDRDFRDLWEETTNRLLKIRCFVEDWEVDFFLEGSSEFLPTLGHVDRVYFILAEHEMPEGREEPEQIHPLVERRLVYAVPRGDDSYSNRRLGNVRRAAHQLDCLLKQVPSKKR